MADLIINRYPNFQGSGVGTSAGVTVTQSASTGRTYAVTGIQVSSDLACLVTIESPAATVIYRKRLAGTGGNFSEVFEPGVLQGGISQAVLVKISASTANCEANIQGFQVF